MGDFEIRGADAVGDLSKRLKTHGNGVALRKELMQGLNRVSKPVRADMKAATGKAPVLPTRGGLQALTMSKQSVTTSLQGGKWPALRIVTKSRKGGIDIGAVHRTGRLRHPVFGKRAWVTQTKGVQPRWQEPAFKAQEPAVKKALVQVMEDIAKKVEG